MGAISFKNGSLAVTDKKLAIFLSFSQSNSESDIYNKAEKSLPKIKGLKRPIKRVSFAFDLVDTALKNKCWLSWKSNLVNFKK